VTVFGDDQPIDMVQGEDGVWFVPERIRKPWTKIEPGAFDQPELSPRARKLAEELSKKVADHIESETFRRVMGC